MDVGKNDNYIVLSEVTFDDDNVSDQEDENGLCVPQDRLEDIDFFPNFDDDCIRLDHVFAPDVGCNQDSVKDLCDSRDDHGEVSSFHHYRDLSSANETEEIERNVTSKSSYSEHIVDGKKPDVCFGQEAQEQKLRGNTLYFQQEEDEWKGRELEISSSYHNNNIEYDIGGGKVSFVNKKPRTKIWRKENRNLIIPELKEQGGNRSSRLLMPRERKRKRCTHCQAEDTPQWRTGPAGRNALCNACGLRYKMGRLVPNYRPAASPSFDCTKHSNFYRRLMRKE